MDGYLKIKTKLDNKDVDKGVAELENKIKKLQTDNSNQSQEENILQKEIDQYERMCQEADKYKQELKELEIQKNEMFKANPALAVTVDTPEYANIKAQIADMKQKYAEATTEIDKQAPKIEKVYSKLEKVKAKQAENNAKISEFNQRIEQINIGKVQSGLNTVGKNIQSQISKIGKMAMAVIGIRTAWNAVRSAVSIVTQYNSQVSADFEYMRYCIANVLAPVVQGLIKLLYTVLSYVNAIASAWFGINIFGNASVKNFKKMQSSAGSTAKSAKEIAKSLQGFDEMNVLQDNSTESSSSSGGGAVSPSMDLSGMQGEVPAWLQWIIDNKGTILAVLAGIATGIASMKLLNLLSTLGLIKNELLGIKALGIGIVVAGIALLIQDIIGFINDPSWANFGKILTDIGIILLGVAAIFTSIPLAVAGAIAVIVGLVITNWDKICEVLGAVGQWIYDHVIKPVIDFFVGLWNKICEIFSPVISFFSGIFGTVLENAKIMIENAKQIFSFLWEKIKEIFGPVVNFFSDIFKNAFEAVKNVFTPIINFFSSIWSKVTGIFKNIGQKIGQAISGAFKSAVNAVLRTIENVLNTPIRAINSLIGVINQVPGLNLGYLNTFNLPRLAKGGIIAQPTQAIIGEAGAEAVVPLENNLEWLDKLADMISSKISGGGNVNVYLDGRLIQRQIAKRGQQLAFSTNS